MRQETLKITPVFISDTQPVAIRGLQSLIGSHPTLKAAGSSSSLDEQGEIAHHGGHGILVLDRAFGQRALLDFLASLRFQGSPLHPIIWGASMSDAEALRYLQNGARGILQKTAPLSTVLSCLEAVAGGKCWMQEPAAGGRGDRSSLTPREQQVMELVEQGFKNREIANELGIRPGTVKIHLKHIFEKTGAHGRYGLALNGLRARHAMPTSG